MSRTLAKCINVELKCSEITCQNRKIEMHQKECFTVFYTNTIRNQKHTRKNNVRAIMCITCQFYDIANGSN